MRGRILFVAPSAYTVGGLATWLDVLEPALRDLGWETVVGLVEGARHHRPDAYLAEHPHRTTVAVTCHTGTPEGRRRAVRRAVEDVGPDLVLTVNIPDAVVAVGQLGGTAPRVVMTVHGIQTEIFRDVAHLRPLLAGVVATNRLGRRLAERLGGVDGPRALYAPCGVPLPEAPGPERQRATGGGPLRLGFVGRLDEREKRVLDLPEILRATDALGVPTELLVAGDGPDAGRLAEGLAPWIRDGRARLLGRIPRARLGPELYDRIDALLVTSPSETGPIVAWEAMARGVVVVASRYLGSGLEAALVHGETALLFDVGDAVGAAGCIQRLAEDREAAERMRRTGRAMVESRYSAEASGRAWDRALRSILALPRPTPDGRPVPTGMGRRGRLDAWLGPAAAETVRGWSGRLPPDGGPGGEWPHSFHGHEPDDGSFRRAARKEDRRDAGAEVVG